MGSRVTRDWHVSWAFAAVTKNLSKQLERKDCTHSFRGSIHSHLAPLFLGCGQTEPHGGPHGVKQSSSPHGGQEREIREPKRPRASKVHPSKASPIKPLPPARPDFPMHPALNSVCSTQCVHPRIKSTPSLGNRLSTAPPAGHQALANVPVGNTVSSNHNNWS